MAKDKLKYSNEELEEFKVIIEKKLEQARNDIEILYSLLDNNDINQTKIISFEESASTFSKESNMQLISRLKRFVRDLENALIRIDNKTYGICRETGKLISKERLKVVPHATLSINAKKAQGKK